MNQLRPTMARGSPRGMATAKLPRDAIKFVETEAIDIFITMTNGGCTFQQALAAIFMSGMNLAKTLEES